MSETNGQKKKVDDEQKKKWFREWISDKMEGRDDFVKAVSEVVGEEGFKALEAERVALRTKLFKTYNEKSTVAKQKAAEAAEAEKNASKVIGDIHEWLGSGPFNVNGKNITATKRGESYYFRGESQKTVESI